VTDRKLAFTAYSLCGIPASDWNAHLACDCEEGHHSKLTTDARNALAAIVGSYRNG